MANDICNIDGSRSATHTVRVRQDAGVNITYGRPKGITLKPETLTPSKRAPATV